MITLSSIFTQYGKAYIDRYRENIPKRHIKAINDIIKCQTELMGYHYYECEKCGKKEIRFHSCRNRSCNKCQGLRSKQWVDDRNDEVIKVTYFHVVFTLPSQLQPLFRANQRKCYDILLKGASQAIQTLAKDKKYFGAKLGIIAILHTWSTSMAFHPHVHMIIPGGTLSKSGIWKEANKHYLLPYDCLEKIYKAIIIKNLKSQFKNEVDYYELWKKKWVIELRSTEGHFQSVIKYLSGYVNKIAINDKRILKLENGNVTFEYKRNDDRDKTVMVLPVFEFMRRYLLHVLPCRFVRIRYYGFLHQSQRNVLGKIQNLINFKDLQEIDENKVISIDNFIEVTKRNHRTEAKCPVCNSLFLVLIFASSFAFSP
jgi:hypothetical protein